MAEGLRHRLTVCFICEDLPPHCGHEFGPEWKPNHTIAFVDTGLSLPNVGEEVPWNGFLIHHVQFTASKLRSLPWLPSAR